MNKIFIKAALALTTVFFFNVTSFAVEKVILKGNAIQIKKEGDVYTVPADVTVPVESEKYLFAVDNGQRVCYRTVQPAFQNISAGAMSVRIAGKIVQLHCYNYNTEYFTTE